MKIGIIGYGKMGKAIEKMALHKGYEITYRIDSTNQKELTSLCKENIEIAIEFSQPSIAYNNIYTCLQQGIPVISGTTGWLAKMPEIEHMCKEQGGTFFYASNFSLAVNIFFKLNLLLAKYMHKLPEFDLVIEETHHVTKKDQPSGTAIKLAEDIIQNVSRRQSWRDTIEDSSILTIRSKRIADSIGTHVVNYSSPLESLELKHTANSRESFAQGVILVAEWLKGKKGVLGMEDFLQLADN